MTAAPTTTEHTVLQFITPPPGLAPLTQFELANVSPELYTLRAVEAPDIRLFLLDPRPYFPDYAPQLPQDALAELGTADPAVLVVVRPAEAGVAPTANLLAPVLVDPEAGTALQVILEGDWPLRARVGSA